MRSAARYVAEHEAAGDVVIAPVVGYVFDHYFDGDAEVLFMYRGQTGSDERVLETVAERTRGLDRLWFVNSRLWHMDPALRTPRVLDERYRRLDRVEFDGVVLSLYSLEEADDGATTGEQ